MNMYFLRDQEWQNVRLAGVAEQRREKRNGFFSEAGLSEMIAPKTFQHPGRNLRRSAKDVISFE